MSYIWKWDIRLNWATIIIGLLLCTIIHMDLAKLENTGFLANIYSFKVNNRNTRKICEICLKLTIMTSFWCLFVFLLTLDIFHTFFLCFSVDFEQANVSWVYCSVKYFNHCAQ